MIRFTVNAFRLKYSTTLFLRTFTAVVSCCFLVFLTSCSGSNPAGNEEVSVYDSGYIKDSTYTNAALSFQINAPHGWDIRLRDLSKGDDPTLLASCVKSLPLLPSDGLLDLTVLFSTDPIESNELIQELSDAYLDDTSWNTFSIDSAVTKTIGQFSGVWFEVSGNRGTPSFTLKTIQFIFKIDNYNVLITVLCPSNIYEEEKNNISACFHSLTKLP